MNPRNAALSSPSTSGADVPTFFLHDGVVRAVQHRSTAPAHEQEEQAVNEPGRAVAPGARASRGSGTAR